MRPHLIRLMACSAGLALLWATELPSPALAQGDAPPPGQVDAPARTYSPQQLDQLLAPIALYPDSLLGQILMASTYPLEVVSATRWVQDSGNGGLQGASLYAALDEKDWDPSVKALVPFPQILHMMDGKLDWTQSLGNAFLAQQADIMDSVQRLRAEAQRAGTLRSSPQETIATRDDSIVIEPTDPERVYVPYYDTRSAYGSWGYPDYPPDYFPPPAGYGYASGPGIYFSTGFGIGGGLWGWDSWDWRRHDLHVDADRYNRINRYAIQHDNRPNFAGNSWQHDPGHRRGVPYADPAVRQRFPRANAATAETRRDFRGVDTQARPGFGRPAASEQGRPRVEAPQPGPRPIAQRNDARPAPITLGGAAPRPAVQRPIAPAFVSAGRGADVRAQSQRGQASRQSMPQAAAPQRSAAPQQQGGSHGGGQQGGGQPGGGQRGGAQHESGQKGGGNDKHGH